MPAPSRRIRLRPGVRVSHRGPGSLQVGLHADQRLLLADSPDVRRLLAVLPHGLDPERLPPADRAVCGELDRAGLLTGADDAAVRSRLRAATRVCVVGSDDVRASAGRLLAAAGLGEGSPRGPESVRLVVSTGAEPRRERLDRLMQDDRPHLLVTALAGRVRLGPCVVPGLTACQRCVDEHLTDADPRHPLVVEQHLAPDPDDLVPPLDLQLALAWAVRDLVALVEGDRPTTWSATVELGPDGPVSRTWRRHPRCGCAWADALAG